VTAAPLAAGAAGIALWSCGGAPPVEHGPTVSPVPLTRAPVNDPDEPGDSVEVVTEKGHLEPAAVDAGIAPYRAALSSCYTRRVGKRPWLNGHLVLRWEVAADGSIERLLLAESDLGAWPVEKCVLEAVREARFGKPIGGPAEVSLPLEFSARAQPAVAATWDDEQSQKAVGAQLARLDACSRGKSTIPDEVRITVYAGPRGRALSVGFASATAVLEADWADCAEKAALRWRLPDPRGQVTKLAVRYRPR
jgi:hypothetical protein